LSMVGVLGCGQMGRGIIKNLIQNGFEVFVFDVNKEAVKLAEQLGATSTDSVRAIAEKVSYLITSLPNSKIVEDSLLGDHGALHHMATETFILDFSTIDVGTTKRLYERAKEKGISFFDCPVSGGPDGANAGTLTIMVGGDLTYFEQIKPVLHALGKEIEYIGNSGSGQTVKLCCNMVVAGIVALLSEALLTGAKAGVPAVKIAEVMQKGSAQNKVLSVFGPNMLEGTHENVKFLLGHMTKDIHLYSELAKQEKIPSFLSNVITQLFDIANNQGKGGLDTSAVSLVLEELSDSKMVSKSS
jgi:3-hydroxyisobutyrate dehydrogenase